MTRGVGTGFMLFKNKGSTPVFGFNTLCTVWTSLSERCRGGRGEFTSLQVQRSRARAKNKSSTRVNLPFSLSLDEDEESVSVLPEHGDAEITFKLSFSGVFHLY